MDRRERIEVPLNLPLIPMEVVEEKFAVSTVPDSLVPVQAVIELGCEMDVGIGKYTEPFVQLSHQRVAFHVREFHTERLGFVALLSFDPSIVSFLVGGPLERVLFIQ